MSRTHRAPCALALALFASPLAHGASDAELAEIRAQIRDLKSSYESRIQALEQRLRDAESKAAAPAASPATAARTPAAAASTANAFNPAISLVLQGRYAHLSRDPAGFGIAGFAPAGEEAGPGRRGFSLGESELTLSANVDHKFAGRLTFALSPENTVEVEEAYGLFTAAPHGLAPKLGRFFSGIGYLNEQHQHAWDFIDAPLAYQAFFGRQYAQDGVQVKWVAPLDHYVQLGAEVGNGDAFPGTPRNTNGAGSAAGYIHTGGDLGASHSWRAGLSYLETRAEDRDGFTGKSRMALADLVWKYAPQGNARDTNFKLQGEYIRRKEKGDPGFDSRQSGWYLQGVYQFMPMWRVGARYDRLDAGEGFAPKRSSVMLDWSPSEFSRLRLQFARSSTQPEITDNQWFLQYILSLGAHGAHRY